MPAAAAAVDVGHATTYPSPLMLLMCTKPAQMNAGCSKQNKVHQHPQHPSPNYSGDLALPASPLPLMLQASLLALSAAPIRAITTYLMAEEVLQDLHNLCLRGKDTWIVCSLVAPCPCPDCPDCPCPCRKSPTVIHPLVRQARRQPMQSASLLRNRLLALVHYAAQPSSPA